MVKVKICGNTTLKDTMAAVEAGADAVGFIFHAKSPRNVSPKNVGAIVSHLPPFVVPVGVFVDEHPDVVRRIMADCGLAYAQLHGNESNAYCAGLGQPVIKAIRVRTKDDLAAMDSYRVRAILLDTRVEGMQGGTGVTFDWDVACSAKSRGLIILAGGLTPENVASAVTKVRPYGVDVSSGVEVSPGIKDPAKVRAFIANAKAADA